MYVKMLHTGKKSTKKKAQLKALISTEASKSLVSSSVIDTKIYKSTEKEFSTAAGDFKTSNKTVLNFQLTKLCLI